MASEVPLVEGQLAAIRGLECVLMCVSTYAGRLTELEFEAERPLQDRGFKVSAWWAVPGNVMYEIEARIWLRDIECLNETTEERFVEAWAHEIVLESDNWGQVRAELVPCDGGATLALHYMGEAGRIRRADWKVQTTIAAIEIS